VEAVEAQIRRDFLKINQAGPVMSYSPGTVEMKR
jgi:hypothetical protein